MSTFFDEGLTGVSFVPFGQLFRVIQTEYVEVKTFSFGNIFRGRFLFKRSAEGVMVYSIGVVIEEISERY
jgi:hypothetical protein